tara:strand:- start:413 stop:799 length:387 start_codon:yes stop_codon:yes gene_type:complete
MRCPACGYTTHPTAQSREAKLFFKEFPDYIQEPLKELYFFFSKRIPKDKLNRDWNKLVYAIDVADHDVVRASIGTYKLHEYHLEGKDLGYLKAIINRNNATYKQKKRYELDKYGANPPEINTNEENND